MLSIKINKAAIALVMLISLPVLAQYNKVEIVDSLNDPALESSHVPQQTPVSSNIDGVAIDGYDPVTYFTENKAIKGSEQHVCDYNGTTWHFSSQENRDLFLNAPEKYTPEYGGYCSHSITENDIVTSNPEAFVVRDDKLYLYANQKVLDQDLKKDEVTLDLEFKKRKTNWSEYEVRF